MNLADSGLPRDLFEPYTARVGLSLREMAAEPRSLVADLLEEIAGRCEEAGASLIGHIKCHVVGNEDSFHCNLTSRRAGARCSAAGPRPEDVDMVQQPSDLRVDLAVLVYGLTRSRIEAVVHEVCKAASNGSQAWWLYAPQPVAHDHHHSCDDPHSSV